MLKPVDILLFLSDQHAAVYGPGERMAVDTPHLDALCRRGTSFTAAYTPCPLCVPARMAMLSGQAPHRTGIYTNNDTLPQTVPTFLHAMAAAGYETVLCGRMHFIGPDQRHGFTRRIAPDFTPCGWTRPLDALRRDFGVHLQTMGYKWCTDVVGGGASPVTSYDEMVLQELEHYLSAPHRKPQLIVVGTYGPHFPYVAPEALFRKYLADAQLPPSWPGREEWLNDQQRALLPEQDRRDIALACQAAYKGLVEHTDALVGQAERAFARFCAERGTPGLFGYVSDHGDTVGEHGIYGKKSFFEAAVRVPMIFSGEGVTAGRRVPEPVSLLDIGPTLCEWAGVDFPLPTDGHSLAAVLRGAGADASRTVYSELTDRVAGRWAYTAMARQGVYKYITCHGDESHDQLFDLSADPWELHNLAAEDPPLARQFSQRMLPGPQASAQEERQRSRAQQMALLAAAETAAGGSDPERFHGYPPEAKQPPACCVTTLADAPGKSQHSVFIGLPDLMQKEKLL